MYFKSTDDTMNRQFSLIAHDFGIGEGEGEPYDTATGFKAMKVRFTHAVKSGNKQASLTMYLQMKGNLDKAKAKGGTTTKKYKEAKQLFDYMKEGLVSKGWAKKTGGKAVMSADADEKGEGEKTINSNVKQSAIRQVKSFVVKNKKPIMIVSGAIVLYLGYRFFFRNK